jgi:divalent metal cation (Fe/Co/Zn/Cd) transporter
MLFGISGFISLQQGFSSLISTVHHIENVNISYIILVISAIFEANALRVVLELSKRSIEARGEKFNLRTLLYEFQESKDPSVMTIMVEDSAALLGIAIAGIGIFLSNQTGNTIYDSISSLLIGAILMAFAFFLARENKGLLIGEAISRQEYKRIVRLIKEIPEVNKIITIHNTFILLWRIDL